jgi:hypothetical protein
MVFGLRVKKSRHASSVEDQKVQAQDTEECCSSMPLH